MNPADISINDLVPHDGNMILIDRLLEAGSTSAKALVTVRNNGVFIGDQSAVPAWAGIEYMAQTIAAYAGFLALQINEEVKVGFLLGARKYLSPRSHFNCGETLIISIDKVLQDENGLASFNCKLEGQGCLIEATLSVFQPKDPDAFLEQSQQF